MDLRQNRTRIKNSLPQNPTVGLRLALRLFSGQICGFSDKIFSNVNRLLSTLTQSNCVTVSQKTQLGPFWAYQGSSGPKRNHVVQTLYHPYQPLKPHSPARSSSQRQLCESPKYF